MTGHAFRTFAKFIIPNPFMSCMLIDNIQVFTLLCHNIAICYGPQGNENVFVTVKMNNGMLLHRLRQFFPNCRERIFFSRRIRFYMRFRRIRLILPLYRHITVFQRAAIIFSPLSRKSTVSGCREGKASLSVLNFFRRHSLFNLAR